LKLVDLPGVGSRIRERLIEHYGSEENALQAILDGDVTGLTRGLSERQALLLVQYARGMKYGIKPDDFLATDEVFRVYQMLIARIESYAHTEYARHKIATLFPSSSETLLAENRKMIETAIEYARLTQGQGISDLLSMIKPLRKRAPSRVRERAVAVSSAKAFQQLKARGLDKLIDLYLTESPRELVDLAASYSHVSFVGEEIDGPPGIELALSLDEWYLAPEAALGFFTDNLDTLLHATKAALKLRDLGVRSFAKWDNFARCICKLNERDDREAERLSRIAERLGECVRDAASWANDELKKKIEMSSLTLGGNDLLMVMTRGEGVQELFELQMKGVFHEALLDAKVRIARDLELKGPETVWLDEIFPEKVCFPLEINRQALHSFEQELRSRIEERGLKARRELARDLEEKKGAAFELVRALMEFDFLHALGSFALEEELCMPEIAKEPCLSFECGRNLSLNKPDLVSYSLGTMDHPEKVVILSGVNSGGKTSLLDLIAQIVILGHMGLPVPARLCKMSLYQEMYYFSKSRGTLTAGAFETAIRKFSVVENKKQKLVLADELEAITEPGASARIIACMLDELNCSDSLAVFVSHLAEDIRRYAETAVRVDGIDAEGLDEKNNLIVNRSPKYNYLAKSTPELILDRLVRSAKSPEREFYARLLAKFR